MTAFLATNILLYAISSDPADHARKMRAREFLLGDDHVLSVQVLNEFIWQTSRPGSRAQLDFDTAMQFVDNLRRFRIVALDIDLVSMAADVRRRTNYSWWDSLIVAAAISAGCDRIVTENLRHGRVIDGIRVENPFRELA